MKKFLTLILPLLLLTVLSNCRWFTDAKMSPLAFAKTIEVDGTPKFKQGFQDGCETVLHSRGYGFYRSKYKWKFNPNLIDDPEYSFGRKRGYNYCFDFGALAKPKRDWIYYKSRIAKKPIYYPKNSS